MGAVEHLKTLSCLGLPPEAAMIAITPLLHEIIPHGWARMGLFEPDATIVGGYAEHPGTGPLFRENLHRFMNDAESPGASFPSAFKATAIGHTLHLQGSRWLESAYYREMEAPLDACWILDAMIGDENGTFAAVNLTRPRSARPFGEGDLKRLDHLRPWLAHALRRRPQNSPNPKYRKLIGYGGRLVASGQMILTWREDIVFQTSGLEFLLAILSGEFNYTQRMPAHSGLDPVIRALLRRLGDAADGAFNSPPRIELHSPYGLLTLDAKWLTPPGAIPGDVAKDPKSCFIAVAIELREHAIAHAVRILRNSGATPAQLKIGIQLGLGKTKSTIAAELGLKPSSVADLTKKLYQRVGVHNAAELGLKLWMDQNKHSSI